MKIQGQFREIKRREINANNEVVDSYYLIPEHDDNLENAEQEIKFVSQMFLRSKDSGEE